MAAGLALFGGWAWAQQFEAEPFTVAPWLALVPLLLLLDCRRPGLWAWLCGAVFWLASIPWILPTLVDYGQLSPALAWPLFVGVAVYLGSYWGAFGWLGARLWRRGGGVALVGLPALWVALEHLRDELSGFPWNLAAYSVIDVPGVLPGAAWIGPFGWSALVVLANVGLAQAVRRRRWQWAAIGLLIPGLAMALGGRWGNGERHAVAQGETREVRLLQPNIPNRLAVDDTTWENYDRLAEMSRRACNEAGNLVVWPESGGWPMVYPRDGLFARDVGRTVEAGCPVLFNTTTLDPEGPFNSAVLLAPGQPPTRYDKRHLVPFGEYVPWSGLFSFIDSLARNAGDYRPARELQLLGLERERIGMAICFEVTFPGEVAATVQAGATLLATLTNDAWYGDTSAPWQHLRAARFRAAENRRPLLRAAITGVSGLVDSRGRMVVQLGVGREGILHGRVEGRRDLSPYTRVPWLVPALAWLVAAAMLGVARRSRSEVRRLESTDTRRET